MQLGFASPNSWYICDFIYVYLVVQFEGSPEEDMR